MRGNEIVHLQAYRLTGILLGDMLPDSVQRFETIPKRNSDVIDYRLGHVG